MYTRIFVHSNGPGGAVHGGGEDLKKRLDPGAREGQRQGRELPAMYTRIFVHSNGPGGAVHDGRKVCSGA
jgi:hypothetical protein